MTREGSFGGFEAEKWLGERCQRDGKPSKNSSAFILSNGRQIAVSRRRKSVRLWIEPFESEIDGVDVVSRYPASRSRTSNLNGLRGARLMTGREALLVRVSDPLALYFLIVAYGEYQPTAPVCESYDEFFDENVLPMVESGQSEAEIRSGLFRHAGTIWEVVAAPQIPLVRARSYPGDPFEHIRTDGGTARLQLRAEFLESDAEQVTIVEAQVRTEESST